MNLLALQLSDSAISCLYRGEVAFVESGYAAIDAGRLVFGGAARQHMHSGSRSFLDSYWRDLSQQPLDRPELLAVDGLSTNADIVHAHVDDLWKRCPSDVDAVVCTVPPYWSKEQLALLSGIFVEVGIPLKALADNAVASVRREYVGSTVSVVESSLHDVTISIMQQSGGAEVTQRLSVEDVSIQRLETFCVEYISAQFLEQCRFDPTSTGNSERVIYDRLYTWLGRVGRESETSIDLEYGGNRFQATLTAAGISNAIFGFFEPVALRFRELCGPGDRHTVLLDFDLAGFPGVARCFESVAGALVEVLQPAAGAMGVLARANAIASDDGEIRYLTRLPWDQPPFAVVDAPASAGATVLSPTHVLISNVAYPLGDKPFEIGADIDERQYGMCLSGPDVSRAHCSIHLEENRVIVSDHSRSGTRVNGHRIDGSVVLRVGDVIGVGDDSGAEFFLIREEHASGTASV